MSLTSFLRFLDKVSPPAVAHAHCDIPCGVYETDSMKWAVETCEKLVKKMLELEVPNWSDRKMVIEYQNTVARAVHTKEEYAEICKRQALILWTDYFKAEHLTSWPDLHEKVWKLTKQCSIVKRNVSLEECTKLREMVKELAGIFAATKK